MMSASLPSSNPKAKALQAVQSSFVVLDLSAFFHRLLPIPSSKDREPGTTTKEENDCWAAGGAHVE